MWFRSSLSLLVLFMLLLGTGFAQDTVLEDGQGRFSVPVPNGWASEIREDGVIVITDPDQALFAYALTLDGDDLQANIESAWAQVFPETPYDAESVQVQDIPAPPEFEALKVVTLLDMQGGTLAQIVGQQRGGISYLLGFAGSLQAAQRRNAQIQIIATGFTVSDIEQTDLSGSTPSLWNEALSAELDAFINEGLTKFEVPGLALAIVQNGEIVYVQGYGKRDESGAEVTPETQFMIGSTSKTFTVTRLAQLVDAGVITWDTPVVELLPSFRVADAEISQTLTVQNLVCACTGVPRRDYELFFNTLTPADIIEAISTFEFFTGFGEAFQYSNQMVAMGGYAAALAEGASTDNLIETYNAGVQTGILDVLDMSASNGAGSQLVIGDNVAMPYGVQLPDQYVLLEPADEFFVDPLIPAGGLWSNVLDMSAYMLAWLNDGEGLVSPEQLELMWTPQVPIDATTSYGLGWILGEYKGLRTIGHGGNMIGYTSAFEFLPEADFGVIVLSNARAANALTDVIVKRAYELAFGLENSYVTYFDDTLAQAEKILAEFDATLEIDPAQVEAYLGTWTNEFLGDVTFSLNEDGELVADVGEFSSRLMHNLNTEGDVQSYLMQEPPVAGISFSFESDESGTPVIYIDKGSAQEYLFVKQS